MRKYRTADDHERALQMTRMFQQMLVTNEKLTFEDRLEIAELLDEVVALHAMNYGNAAKAKRAGKVTVDIEVGEKPGEDGNYGYVIWHIERVGGELRYTHEEPARYGFKDWDDAENAAAAELDARYGADGWEC